MIEMTDNQIETLIKFEGFARFMCDEISKSLLTQASFLPALGLFTYIEIVGSFITGQFKKDQHGNIIKDQKGQNIITSSKDKFNAFFKLLGSQYQILIDSGLNVYDELRCGLVHEYLPKSKLFAIESYDKAEKPEETKMDICGAYHTNENGKDVWYIVNCVILRDFERAICKLINEVKSNKNKILNINFFERAKYINFNNFG